MNNTSTEIRNVLEEALKVAPVIYAFPEYRKIMRASVLSSDPMAHIKSAIAKIDYDGSNFGKFFIFHGYRLGKTVGDMLDLMTKYYNSLDSVSLTDIKEDAIGFFKCYALEEFLRSELVIPVVLVNCFDGNKSLTEQFLNQLKPNSKASDIIGLYRTMSGHKKPSDCGETVHDFCQALNQLNKTCQAEQTFKNQFYK